MDSCPLVPCKYLILMLFECMFDFWYQLFCLFALWSDHLVASVKELMVCGDLVKDNIDSCLSVFSVCVV